jgi:hypothetical protein
MEVAAGDFRITYYLDVLSPSALTLIFPSSSLFSTVDAISDAQVPSPQGTQIQHIAIAV